MDSKQAIINAIAERLGALRQRPCPGHTTAYGSPGESGEGVCGSCRERLDGLPGTITEPRYQAAWEMLWPLASHLVVGGVPSAYTKHPIVGWPDCAVVGLLEGVVRKVHSPKLYAFLVNWKHDPNYGSVAMLSDLYMRGVTPFRWPDPDDAQGLGKALLEALNGHV